jgi:hypothetical protein
MRRQRLERIGTGELCIHHGYSAGDQMEGLYYKFGPRLHLV